MAPKRSRRVEGSLVKTTKKVVEETLIFSVLGSEGSSHETVASHVEGSQDATPVKDTKVVEVVVEDKNDQGSQVVVTSVPSDEEQKGEENITKGKQEKARDAERPTEEKTTQDKQEESAPSMEEETTQDKQEESAPSMEEETTQDKQEESAPSMEEETTQDKQEESAPSMEEETTQDKQEESASSMEEDTTHDKVEEAKEAENPTEKLEQPPKIDKKEPRKTAGKEKEKKREGEGIRRRKRRRVGGGGTGEVSYKRYVFRVLKQVHPGMRVSSGTMAVLDGLMRDMFERLAEEAARLSKYTGRATLSSREIEDAVRLVLPGELGKHAIAEGTKAVTNYMTAERDAA